MASADTLILKTAKQPTILNKEMVIGALLGLMMPLSGLAFLGAGVAGAVIGGLAGKERIEKEKNVGKIVSNKPSFWNKDALLGGLIGSHVGTILGIAAAAMIIGPEIATAFISGEAATTAITAAKLTASAAALIGSWVAGIGLGAYIGGKHGQKTEREEYAMAATQQPEIVKQRGYDMQISQEHATHIERERERARDQEKTR